MNSTLRDLIESGEISLDTVVLGELQKTKDGCVWGSGPLFEQRRWPPSIKTIRGIDPDVHTHDGWEDFTHVCVKDCFSSREAAERAVSEFKL